MPRFLSFMPVIALLALSAPVMAQETADGDATATESETPAGETAEPATGDTVPSDGEPALGQTYVKEEVGDWELRCIRTETPADDPCQLYQLLKEGDGNALAEISLFRLPEEAKLPAGATVIVPLETLLTGQLGISVDGGQPKSYPFSFCNRQGCYARIGLTAEDIAAFKRGAEAKVMIRPFAAPDQVVTSTMSLTGFTAGYDKASVINQ
ncbi:MAG: invasion associated locus B family protein [Marinovum algicola]|jgi:invasion protein IalB|uniref:Invasion protein IalB, involved in pathogenesis n=1 Tax=Marinovum algicola TaxID=42444 RepID=A0A975W8E3_9RHOB|nr:invasion associated locus B family protein [Marinovum algicola]SEJ08233.1 Invasion protein IalB, involved in pathogenesis [Marinovum algicola]SLN19996.1 Invasion associated locus B (IalB) protein [Marinovum algicola]